MAVPTNTLKRSDLGSGATDNVREDLSDVIYNISPTETPFTVNAERGKAKNSYTEWSIDELPEPANNAHLDGDDFSGDALDKAERLGNYMQISRKDLQISGRAEVVNKAGRKSEMAYQVAKQGKALKRDIETAACMRKVASAEGSDAAETAGVPAWIRTNINRGTSGTAPTLSGTTTGYPNAIGTGGTERALTETAMLNGIRSAYDEGGMVDCIMVTPKLKQGISAFLYGSDARIATPYQDLGKMPKGGATVVGAVDHYVSDFGAISMVPNRFMPTDTATSSSEMFMLEKEKWEISYLRPYHVTEISQNGDSQRRMLIADWGVVSKNEAASAIVADLKDGDAVTKA